MGTNGSSIKIIGKLVRGDKLQDKTARDPIIMHGGVYSWNDRLAYFCESRFAITPHNAEHPVRSSLVSTHKNNETDFPSSCIQL